MFWRERYRIAASSLLSSMALLAVLDYFARSSTDPPGTSALFLALALGLGAIYAGFTDWKRLPALARVGPAVASVIALLGSIYWADSASTSHAAIGFSAAAVLILAYIGFVLQPGSALFFSPLLVLTLLGAHLQDEFRITLALPLIAAPVAAILGELISLLTELSVKATRRSTNRDMRLTKLEDVLRRFRRPASLREAAHEVAVAAMEIFDVERATVVLSDNRDGLIPVTLGPSSTEEPDPVTAQLVVETIGGDEPKLVPGANKQTMLVLPLPAAGRPAGAVLVQPIVSEDPDFSLDLARLFGTQVGIAIEHLFVIEELERATTRDQLTGIGNRKHADSLLDSMQPGDALILLDLDGFKAVNDTYGHTAGDQVLQDLSSHLRHCLRDSDTSARLGGDEFLIVAKNAFADPLKVADRILVGWANAGRTTTLSAGVALHEPDVEPSDTFDRADQALYQAKADGKNRAHRWRHEIDSPASSNGYVAEA